MNIATHASIAASDQLIEVAGRVVVLAAAVAALLLVLVVAHLIGGAAKLRRKRNDDGRTKPLLAGKRPRPHAKSLG